MTKTKSGFDGIAFIYDFMKHIVFQKTLEKAENYFLTEIPFKKNVLIVGGGTGAFLIELLKANKAKNIVYLDQSAQMICRAKKRIATKNQSWISKIDFRVGDISEIKPDEQFDIIFTNYFLDVFADFSLNKICSTLNDSIIDNGLWYFTDFSDKIAEGRKPKLILLKFLYRFFRFTCAIEASKLPDFQKAFNNLKYIKMHEKRFSEGFIIASIYKKVR